MPASFAAAASLQSRAPTQPALSLTCSKGRPNAHTDPRSPEAGATGVQEPWILHLDFGSQLHFWGIQRRGDQGGCHGGRWLRNWRPKCSSQFRFGT